MLNLICSKQFTNGQVFALRTEDGYPIEVTDTFLPWETKFCINGTNALQNQAVGSRSERWMVGVSTMSGCPVGCKFCATGQLKKWRKLTADEIFDQVNFVLHQNRREEPFTSQEFKINYTRMGEPFLNLDAVRTVIKEVSRWIPNTHHYVSTIGLKDSDFSWVEGNISLQISLHSFDEDRRGQLIPISHKMSLQELGQIRTRSNLKTTLNLTLVDEKDFDIEKLKKYFDPDYFFIKLSPLNICITSEKNKLGRGIIKVVNLM